MEINNLILKIVGDVNILKRINKSKIKIGGDKLKNRNIVIVGD